MKVSLIRPPVYGIGIMGPQLVPVLGIAYIAAIIRENNHTVDIVDMCGEDIDRSKRLENGFIQYGMPFADLKDRLQPSDVVCFTSMFSQDWPFHKQLIRYARQLLPNAVFVAGGEHVSALAEYCLNDCSELDMIILGEGEQSVLSLLNELESGRDFSKVPNLAYRSAQVGRVVQNEKSARIRNLDELPWPAWDLIPMESYLSRGLTYHMKRGRTIPMVATRGCPYKCTFCSNPMMWGNLWRARSPKRVVDEMEHYIKTYRADNFVFSDLTAVIRRDTIVELCQEIIRRDIKVTWQLPTLRSEAVDYEVLELMYRAGCRELDFAIESGSKEVLKAVKKQNNPDRIFGLIRDGLAVGMNMSANIVIGFPMERWKDFFKTYKLIVKLALCGQQELNVFPFIPYPGSELFKKYVKDGKIKLSDKYFFGLFSYADLSKPVSWSPHFSPVVLNFMRLTLLTSFYGLMLISHPVRLARLIRNMVRQHADTKLEGVLQRIFKNLKASFVKGERYAPEAN